jgi:hypothetical protein
VKERCQFCQPLALRALSAAVRLDANNGLEAATKTESAQRGLNRKSGASCFGAPSRQRPTDKTLQQNYRTEATARSAAADPSRDKSSSTLPLIKK